MEPLRILTAEQMERIDVAAQSILDRTGMKIDSPEALGYLKRSGCRVEEHAGLVRIPRSLSRQVVAKMREDCRRADRPERMPVRFSHVRFRPAEHKVHADFTVSAGGFCCFIDAHGAGLRAG